MNQFKKVFSAWRSAATAGRPRPEMACGSRPKHTTSRRSPDGQAQHLLRDAWALLRLATTSSARRAYAWELVTGFRPPRTALRDRLSRRRRSLPGSGEEVGVPGTDLPLGKKDNFWAMGDNRTMRALLGAPIRPGEDIARATPSPSSKGERPFLELWKPRLHGVRPGPGRRLRPLPSAVDRHGHGPRADDRGGRRGANFDTDCPALIERTCGMAGREYPSATRATSRFRVIADPSGGHLPHRRRLSPANDGRATSCAARPPGYRRETSPA